MELYNVRYVAKTRTRAKCDESDHTAAALLSRPIED